LKHSASNVEDNIRDLDPNVLQRRASDPEHSVWVSASAGTGKTKVLTDRVLRLLLPDRKSRIKTEPHRILCLTFTKAAANEMAIRIGRVLGKWAVISREELSLEIENLTGQKPDDTTIEEARKLFAEVVDAPGGLKIMTIHSFCQSVLGRFPLEAKISPNFSVMDDSMASEILNTATEKAISSVLSDTDRTEYKSIRALAIDLNEMQFARQLKALCSERTQLEGVYKYEQDIEDLKKALWEMAGIGYKETELSILSAACEDASMNRPALLRVSKALAQGTKTDQSRAQKITDFLGETPEQRRHIFPEYCSAFLTKKNEITAKLATKGVLDKCPDIIDVLMEEGSRILEVMDRLKAIRCVSATYDLLVVGSMILHEYNILKEKKNLLDYDDLINKTLCLLRDRSAAPWVMYKLDGGIDHLLIDEAQDTNPEQWKIIDALTDEFFDGYGMRDDIERTIFTVGDEKQSIYSFQRAAPAEFQRMKKDFSGKIKAAGMNWRGDESLNISFRSTKSVLRLVDEVFADQALGRCLGNEAVNHKSFRSGQAGLVELWPLFKTLKKEEEQPWALPLEIKEATTGQTMLADYIAQRVSEMIGEERLESHDREIRAGDIMILVRTRTAFVNQLVRALKKRNVPVSGIDRMVLGEQLSVIDLLALAQFALLPSDDLTLACVLKTPFIGWTEEMLFDLAADRKTSLWQAVLDSSCKETISFLKDIISSAHNEHPYEFFSRILQKPCPADEISGLRAMSRRLGIDALDPIEEFLGSTLSFEIDNIPTLQGFLAWQQANDVIIKREMDESGDHVQIMTVHGSKGLQAPVVILPDTTRTSQAKQKSADRLLWPDKSGLALPLWSSRSENDAKIYVDARKRVEDKLDEEYWRLLYVAMTRAEDRLYVCGYEGSRGHVEDSWYPYIKSAFERLDGVEEFPFGEDERGLRFYNTQTKNADRSKAEEQISSMTSVGIAEPEWLRKNPAPESVPPRPLLPSRPSGKVSVISPLAPKEGKQECFRRGNVTHKLLQLLPDIEQSKRPDVAREYLLAFGRGIGEDVQKEIISETINIIEDKEYWILFGPGSMAEVPVTGMVSGNKLISGQIDRLLVQDKTVWIVDYKTNRIPPDSEEGVPMQYRSQMEAYSELISLIYPDHEIRSFLLWTDGPVLMPLKIQ
jgi:ATP-dependent helicase/nuclease subunit A